MDRPNQAITDIQNKITEIAAEIETNFTQLQSDVNNLSLVFTKPQFDKVTTLNSNLTNTLGPLSDKIINFGKDLIAISDQADQFICIALDTFSRVVDIFVFFRDRKLMDSLTAPIDELKNLISNLDDYVKSRSSLTSSAELEETQTRITADQNIITVKNDSIVNSIVNLNDLFAMAVSSILVIQNTLIVNTVVGIALSVSERAWQELKILHQLPYTSVTQPVVVNTLEDTSESLETNLYFPTESFSEEDRVKIGRFLNRVFLKSSIYTNNYIKYKVLNDESVYIDQDFTNFNVRKTLSDVQSYSCKLPIRMESILEDIIFVKQLDVSEEALTSYYLANDLTITQTEFLSFFQSDEFIIEYNKYVDLSIIDEYNTKSKNQLNFNMLSKILEFSNFNIGNSPIIELSNNMFNSLSCDKEVCKYIKDARSNYIGSSNYYNDFIDIKNLYIATKPSIEVEKKKGVITISRYENDKLTNIITKYNYSYISFQNKYDVYYAECMINDTKFIIDDNKLYISYSPAPYIVGDDITNTKIERTIIEEMKMNGMIADNSLSPIEISPYLFTEDRVKTFVKHATGEKEVTTSNISASYDEAGYKILSNSSLVKSLFTYISDDILERTTINITNVFRKQMLDKKIDFSTARTQSILNTLKYFGYRSTLENFINASWDAKIPRIDRK